MRGEEIKADQPKNNRRTGRVGADEEEVGEVNGSEGGEEGRECKARNRNV
jgi:hypothetical protein